MTLSVVGSLAANSLEAEEFRRMWRGVTPPGVLKSGDFNVSQNGTPNLSVNVAAGEAWVEGSSSTAQGLYYVRNDATVNVPITSTGGIYLRIYDSDYTGSSDTAALEASGTAPASSLKLAQVTVSGSTIVNANIAGTRYRNSNTENVYLVNDSVDTGVLGSLDIFTGNNAKPLGWVEYDLHVHGKFVWYAQLAAGDHARFTTTSQSPSGMTRNEGRISITGHGAGISVYETDPIDVVVNGLTADTSFRYSATSTISGGSVFRRLVIATMTRVR